MDFRGDCASLLINAVTGQVESPQNDMSGNPTYRPLTHRQLRQILGFSSWGILFLSLLHFPSTLRLRLAWRHKHPIAKPSGGRDKFLWKIRYLPPPAYELRQRAELVVASNGKPGTPLEKAIQQLYLVDPGQSQALLAGVINS